MARRTHKIWLGFATSIALLSAFAYLGGASSTNTAPETSRNAKSGQPRLSAKGDPLAHLVELQSVYHPSFGGAHAIIAASEWPLYARFGWKLREVLGYGYSAGYPAPGTAYLNRVTADKYRAMYVTPNPQTASSMISGFGYARKSSPGRVFTTRVPGSRPMYQVSKWIMIGGKNTYLDTRIVTSEPERTRLKTLRYQDQGLVGWILASRATPYFERLASLPASAAPKRIMLYFHGGGWATEGPKSAIDKRAAAQRWANAGWLTINSTYRPNAQSVTDVVALYDATRAMYGPSMKICTTGESAGAHLALMVAVERRSLSCVVAHAGPTDLVNTDKSAFYASIVKDGMGTDPAFLRRNSPVLRAGEIRSKVFLGHHKDDLFVPAAQSRRLAAALGSRATLRELKAPLDCPKGAEGPCLYIHAGAKLSDINALYAAALQFAAAAPATPPA